MTIGDRVVVVACRGEDDSGEVNIYNVVCALESIMSWSYENRRKRGEEGKLFFMVMTES